MSRALAAAAATLALMLALLTGGTSSAFVAQVTNTKNAVAMAYTACRSAVLGSADGVYPRANFLDTLGGELTGAGLQLNDLTGNHYGWWDSNTPSREVGLKTSSDVCYRDASSGDKEDMYYSKLNYSTGAPRHWANTGNRMNPATTTSVEIWFRTSSAGGLLIGLGDHSTGWNGFGPVVNNYSVKKDRQLYIDPTGRLAYALYNATTGATVVRSPVPVTDGRWHHAVGVQAATGTFLYLDGVTVASGPANVGESYNSSAFIHIGADTLAGWDSPAARTYFIGDLMMAAFYQVPLSSEAVQMHYRSSV